MVATVKKKTTKKAVKKATASQRSFVRSKETMPFMTFKATHQTAYWLIICLLVLAIGIWVISLTIRVQNLYDNVQQQSTSSSLTPSSAKK
jgi:hypothetical protein